MKGKQALVPIVILSLICCLIIYLADRLTGEKIEFNRQQATIMMLDELMPVAHDNKLFEDKIELEDLSTSVYRARLGEESVGLVFMPVTTRGYNGKIRLAIGITYDGSLTGVRIIDQQETVGLGDQIDQNISDWVHNFDGRSLDRQADSTWAVSSEGGEFDQLSGATISPRSVINAVKSILDFYKLNRDALYTQ